MSEINMVNSDTASFTARQRDLLCFLWGCVVTLLLATPAFGTDNSSGGLGNLLPSAVRWGLVSVDLKTGNNLVTDGNGVNALLTPASLVKLLSTGTAFEAAQHGHDPDLTSLLLHDGQVQDGVLNGNVYLVAGGNPFLSTDDLRNPVGDVAKQVK